MKPQSKSTVLSLANAAALTTSIVQKLAGNEVANTLNGSAISKDALADLSASHIHARLSSHLTKAAPK